MGTGVDQNRVGRGWPETDNVMDTLVNRVDVGISLRPEYRGAVGFKISAEMMNTMMPERWMTIREIIENLVKALETGTYVPEWRK